MTQCVHNCTSTYARKQGYNWTKNTGMNMCEKSVETSQGGKVAMLWNQKIQTDRTIPNNKPDIIIRDNEKGTVAVSGDGNVIKKKPRRF